MYKRIAVISDLHLDFWLRYYQHKEVTSKAIFDVLMEKCHALKPDLIVSAGDMGNGGAGWQKPFLTWDSDIPVVFVPGNHDFYSLSWPGFDYVYNDHVFGTTLWSNFAGAAGNENAILKQINDYHLIAGCNAYDMSNVCNQAFELIKQMKKEIVVTHFPPARESVAPQFMGDPMNPYFINDFGSQIGQTGAKLWICGHTHWKHSYMIDQCLIVANPCGYPGENYKSISQYEPMLLVKEDEQWKISSE